MKYSQVKLIQIFIVAAILFGCSEADATGIVGSKAPKLNVRQWITASPPTRANLDDRVYVVEFWATWCPHCRQAIPTMIDLTKKYAPKGVIFIALSQDKSAEPVRKMVREKQMNYHVGMDKGISENFLFRGIPHAFVISHADRVAWQGHPLDTRAFEAAIIGALKAAPQPFLADIDLGPFEPLRLRLSGGKDFRSAYRLIKTQAQTGGSQDAKIADEILKELDNRIEKKIEEAAQMRQTDPAAAFELYASVVKDYKGSEVVRPALVVYNELKRDPQVQAEVTATRAFKRAEKVLTECRSCFTCDRFNSACKQCTQLNPIKVRQAKKILTDIRQKFQDTKAAKKSQQLLDRLNGQASKAK